jgi:hypothetical protein
LVVNCPVLYTSTNYSLTQGYYRNRNTYYYDFGPRSPPALSGPASATPPDVASADVFEFVDSLTNQPISGQYLLFAECAFDANNTDAGYSDLHRVVNIAVNSTTFLPNTIRDAALAQSMFGAGTPTGVYRNTPLAIQGSFLSEGGAVYALGWCKNRTVAFFDFGPSPNFSVGIWPLFYGNGTHVQPNIIDAIPSDAGYSPFWWVNAVQNVPASYVPGTIRDKGTLLSSSYAASIAFPNLTVNCPVLRTDDLSAGPASTVRRRPLYYLPRLSTTPKKLSTADG